MILVSPHQAVRPEWTCRRCHLPYPCPEGQRRLVAAHRSTGALPVIAFELLQDAVRDLPSDLPLADLFDRFVAWTEPTRIP